MRTPNLGEKLPPARDGTVYLCFEATTAAQISADTDPGYFIVYLVRADAADDMQTLTRELDSDEFAAFCQDQGILYR